MTPQQKAHLAPGPGEEERRPPPWSQKMKPVVQRRRSTSAISKALSKTKSSREIVIPLSHPDHGLPAGTSGGPSPVFLLDGRVHLTAGLQTRERRLFLFSDRLIVAKSKSSSSLKMKKQVRLSEVWIGSCLSKVSEKKISPENSFVLGWPTSNFIVTYSSPEVKERWLTTLLWHSNEMKQNECPKSLFMQILLMDGDNSSSSTTVSISNTETADDIIKKTTQNLGLPGRPSDYHLWAISGRDGPACPLIGHEHPFSIILGCLRDSLDHLQGTNNHMQLSDENEAFLLDQLPRDRQYQFILKPKPHAPVQLQRETCQKITKRKKSLIDWALRRSTSTPTGSPASQSPVAPRKLFGLSLTSVCPDGSLPKPIMDILQLLYREGPSTRGIFRRSANAKICKELKEKLNSGDQVQVDRESVFVAAAVITDFLRNIPDSVLSSEMHSLWMEAMDKETRAHQTEAVKRLVNQLPEVNLILLRHLFGVLHHIEENSVENQMNAFNLALCIAPNMLWLPSPTGPEEESRSTRKVAMLVQFLIENSAEIFGGDVASLFQRPEKEKPGRSTGHFMAQQNDSSDEMEFAASYQGASKQRSAPEAEDALLGPPGGFPLSQEQGGWDLFSEITACYQSQAWASASADSYGLLEEEASFCSLGSACSLSPARNRCSSEPSVCLSSRLPVQDHEPVARQSSCDAALLHGQGDCIRRLQQLQLESQKLLGEGLRSPGLSRARQTFRWQPPAPSGNPAESLRLQKSSQLSVSSLSSPTSSPSASSLSSLDSAFSCCSESSAFSPTDASSLPVMFGASAGLQALSSKEWQKPLATPLPLNPCNSELRVENRRPELESGSSQGQFKSFVPVSALGSLPGESRWEEGEEEVRQRETLPEGLVTHGPPAPSPRLPASRLESTPWMSPQGQREKTVKHIEIRGLEAAPNSQERLKRTKITVYMAPKERSPQASPLGQEDEDVTASASSDGSSNPDAPKEVHTVRVHIPQTVFYGQQTPLVLQSIVRRYHRESVSHVISPPSAPPLEEPAQEAADPRSHGKECGNGAFSHTFRILLPTSIRNTVQEYFSHDTPKSCCSVEAEAVERELVRSRAEWRRNQPCAGPAAKEPGSLVLAEETFV